MPAAKEITIHLISQTQVNQEAVRGYLKEIDVSPTGIYEVLEARGIVTDPAFVVALAAKQCYKSFEAGLNPNVTRIRKDYVEYLDNILRQGHGSVLEHASFTFAITNVTRVFTAEMNRHRAGWAISEQSMRYIRFSDNINFWMPISFRDADDDTPELREKKKRSRMEMRLAFERTEEAYRRLEAIWGLDDPSKDFKEKKQITSALRRIVPDGMFNWRVVDW